MLLPLLAATVLLLAAEALGAEFYRAAVLEYSNPSRSNSSADEVLIENAEAFRQYMATSAASQVDIIVFPEGGLHGNGNPSRFIDLPSPDDHIAPCDNSSYHQALVILSCASRKYSMYAVINMGEKFDNRTSNKTELYNSNVAFDRKGFVVGRYRKFNPYGESVTKPEVADHHVFETDFGVRFGMFICFDIEFTEPAIVLAREYGIKHFVFPHCWISELPFLTAIQAQWGWAYSLDVVLLASGCSRPSAGGTGSGIFRGRRGAITYFQSEVATSKLLIGNVAIGSDQDHGYDPLSYNEYIGTDALRDHSEVEVDPLSKPLVQESKPPATSVQSQTESLWMLRDYLDVYETKPLEPKLSQDCDLNTTSLTTNLVITETLCQNDFCCEFEVDMTMTYSKAGIGGPPPPTRGDDFNSLHYRMAVFDGVRWYGGGLATGGVQVCGIVACANESLASCGLRSDDRSRRPRTLGGGALTLTSTVFNRVSLVASFRYSATFVYPDLLVSGLGESFGVLLPSDRFEHRGYGPYNNTLYSLLRSRGPISSLVTAALYARQFDRDGLPRTEVRNTGDVIDWTDLDVVFALAGSLIVHILM